MKNPSLILCFVYALLAATTMSAQNSLRVGDPRNSWWTEQGTITEATVSVKPQGAYVEYGLYLTFSATGTQWANRNDSLEVALRFDLPAGAIVHDSWLWIGNDIIKGKILDRWTASAIYEGYVKRRTDPSILFKQGATQYELRIFPMVGKATRRVKISYLLPAQWSQKSIQTDLPISLLRTSRYAPEFTVLAWENPHGKTPKLLDSPGALQPQNPVYPTLYQADFKNWLYPKNITYDAPLKNGYYISTLAEGNEGFYQVAFLPNSLAKTAAPKKFAFLFDYDANGGSLTPQHLLSEVKSNLLLHFTPTDSFNLIFSNLTIKRAANYWLPATPQNIESAFKDAEKSLASYSNLQSLLSNGVQFVQQNGGSGALFLLSNASQFSALQSANTLLNDIFKEMPPSRIPVHTVDCYTQYQNYTYVNGQYYYGNAYLLSTLSGATRGNYYNMLNIGLTTVVKKAFGELDAPLKAFDFHTKLADGFCYGRFDPTGNEEVIFANRPVVQVGKYKGQFPFKIEVSGEINGSVVNGEIAVGEADLVKGDSLLREMWFGQYISLLENEPQNAGIIGEVIETSLAERVLSRYTAFFCPEDPALICQACLDETKLTDVDPEILPDSTLTAYPNPFRDAVTLTLNIGTATGRNAQLDILTVDGRLVRAFPLEDLSGENTLVWDGTNTEGNQAPAGIYMAILKLGRGTKVLKLLKINE